MKKDFRVELPEKPKIAIIGHSGSGKSTLAVKLGGKYGVPVLHTDTIHFLPNWVERETEDELAIMRAFLDENSERGWVIDGNYRKLEYERRMEEANLIIYLNFNRFVCFRRAYLRSRKYRNKTRPSIAPGCNEKFDRSFRKWILRGGRTKEKLKRYKALLAQYPQKSVEINNARQLKEFIRKIEEK